MAMRRSLVAVVVFSTLLACTSACNQESKEPAVRKVEVKELPPYIGNWLICAPFPGEALAAAERERIEAAGYRFAERLRGGFLVDYLESIGGEAAARPNEGDTIESPDGTIVEWKKYNAPSGVVSYGEFLGAPYREGQPWPYHVSVMYGYTTIESDTAGRAFLEIGTDDSGKAYLNGQQVHSAHVIHGWNKRDFVPIDLKEGENTLLIKVEDCGGPGGFIARILEQPPKELATLSMDAEDFNDKHNRLSDFLTGRGYEWTHRMTPNADMFVYSVFARHYEDARVALREAVNAGEAQATLIE